jgi:hypothetical protein
MLSWNRSADTEPDFAKAVRAVFDATSMRRTMATLRKEGSPRSSGIEVTFDGGELWPS